MPTQTSTQARTNPEDLLAGVSQQFKGLLETSGQAIYIYLDDVHKVCNKKFASLLGFKSPDEWARAVDSFEQTFADDESKHALVSVYRHAMDRGLGSKVPVTWRRKDGKAVPTDVILVPLEFGGHRFALNFVEKSE